MHGPTRVSDFSFTRLIRKSTASTTDILPTLRCDNSDVITTTMPKILSRDPAWLSAATPGFNLFQPNEFTSKAQHTPGDSYDGPSRKIAYRGTEIFVAVGNELRWSDLALLQHVGEERHRGKQTGRYSHDSEDTQQERAYKVSCTARMIELDYSY